MDSRTLRTETARSDSEDRTIVRPIGRRIRNRILTYLVGPKAVTASDGIGLPAEDAAEETRSAHAHLERRTFGRLPPLAERALPKCGPMLAMLGPGVVWMALAQGSGELIW